MNGHAATMDNLLLRAGMSREQIELAKQRASEDGDIAKHLEDAPGRVVVVFPGTNTHRLQILFDVAAMTNRKVVLLGESLLRTALVAAVSGSVLPPLLRGMRIDPALAGGVVLTTITDVAGFATFLGLATLVYT